MVDRVVRNYLAFVMDEAEGTEGFECSVERMTSFFYATNRILTPTQLEWIQWEFDVPTVLFEQVGLKTNVKKMASMV